MKYLRANLLLLATTLLIGSVLYPLAVLAVAHTLSPTTASGSLIAEPTGRLMGSRLIAQEFTSEEYFHARPSAVGYTAHAAGGSNWGASNPKLRERAVGIIATRSEKSRIPADAVTASGSGLDPHITRQNANGQLDRVVAGWTKKLGANSSQVRMTVESVLNNATFQPLAGLAGGEPLVNVLEVNWEVQNRFPK